MIASYFRERFSPAVFVPIAACIALAGSAGAFEAARVAADACLALLLLAEFRLWDDLADRRADAVAHPDRVLVKARSIRPFIVTCAALGATNLVLCMAIADAGFSLAVLLLLHSILGMWYAVRSRRTFAGDQLLLAKYPAFVVTVAGARVADAPLPVTVAALAVYALASLYEAWHDPASPVAVFRGGRS